MEDDGARDGGFSSSVGVDNEGDLKKEGVLPEQ